MGIGCLKTKRILFPKREIHDLNSKEYVEMRKLNDNFYTITRRSKHWSTKQLKLLEKYVDYKMFLPIPRNFVKEAIFGTPDPD